MSELFLCLHLCSGEPTLSVCSRIEEELCSDDPPPWYITCVGGWRVYPYAIYPAPIEAIGGLFCTPPPDAIDIFTGERVVPDAPKIDLVALMRKHRATAEPIKRRI